MRELTKARVRCASILYLSGVPVEKIGETFGVSAVRIRRMLHTPEAREARGEFVSVVLDKLADAKIEQLMYGRREHVTSWEKPDYIALMQRAALVAVTKVRACAGKCQR